MKFLNYKNLFAETTKQIYDIGFADADTGLDSKKKEEVIALMPVNKKLGSNVFVHLKEIACRAYVWGWEDYKAGKEKKTVEEIKENIFKSKRAK